MNEIPGRSASDVRGRPDKAEARRALEEYSRQPATGPDGFQMLEVPLAAHGSDFSGADLSGVDLVGAVLYEAMLTNVRMVSAALYHAWFISAELTRTVSNAPPKSLMRGVHPYADTVFSSAQLSVVLEELRTSRPGLPLVPRPSRRSVETTRYSRKSRRHFRA